MAAHRALIVIGMHRSGTSALTRMVNLLGAALPSELLQIDPAVPHETNELGFWEGLEVNTLNNEFLASIGSSWDDTARIPEAVFRSDTARSMRDRIVRHLEAEFADAPLFAIKDPRIGRLAPLWIEALKAFGAEPNFILAFRNPVEVAQSLLKRDQMGRAQATLLWLRHMLEAERNTRNFRRSFVPYEALLENWRGAARRIAEDCDFVWPRFNAGAELAIDAFISPDRRHNSASVSQWAEFPQWPRDVHDVFQQGASGALLDVDVADRISAELDRAGAVFDGYICELDLKVRAQSSELQGLELALEERQGDVADLQSVLESIRSQYQSLDRSLAADRHAFEHQLEELQRERDQHQTEARRFAIERDTEHTSRVALEDRTRQLEAALTTRSGEVAKLEADLTTRSGEVAKLEADLATRSGEVARLEADLTTRSGEVAKLEADLTTGSGEVAKLEADLATRSGEVARLEADLTTRSGEVAKLEADLTTRSGEVAKLEADLATRSGEVARLEADLTTRSGEVAKLQGAIEAESELAKQHLLDAEQERRKLEQRLSQAEAEARAAIVLRRRLEEANDQSDQAREDLERNERAALNANAALGVTKTTVLAMARKLQVKTLEADGAIAELAKIRSELLLAREGADKSIIELADTASELHFVKEGAEDAIASLAAAHSELDLIKEGLRERDALRAQLDAVLVSRTWRLTAPVRKLVRKAKIILVRPS